MPTSRRPGRPARLTRARVIQEAIALTDDAGLDALTMRALARRLGVDPMAVYRHVRDKDDLLGAMCDVLLSDLGAFDADGPWQPQVGAWATELHGRLAARPALLPVLAGAPLTPSAVGMTRSIVELLLRNGLPLDLAAASINAVFSYVVGFATVTAVAPPRGLPALPPDAGEAERTVAALLDEPADFALGLELILEGVTRRAAFDRD